MSFGAEENHEGERRESTLVPAIILERAYEELGLNGMD
jgi:hypothetical protein